MNDRRIDALGEELYCALRERRTLVPLTDREPDITIEDAYRISAGLLDRRLRDGERVVGKKIGVTSKAVQDMLGVFQPDFGFLTDRMAYPDGAAISIGRSGLIQPRAEGEIAFVLKSDLNGPGITQDDVLAATDHVLACFEIVDSRISDWKIRIQDTVADNASCGVYVLGTQRADPRELDLSATRLDMKRNGKPCGSGLGSAVQGHPAAAVAWLANTLGRFGIPFRKGEVILSGSLAPLVPAAAGDSFELTISGIGGVRVSFVD
jgi:2-oxopent-4-enoate/cis-2-oxohex-4-enoate hydratase